MIEPSDTLGHAILRARNMAQEGVSATVVQYHDDHRLAVMPSAEYAQLREQSRHSDLEPLLSFLPHGGLDVHRASFEPIADALRSHSTR